MSHFVQPLENRVLLSVTAVTLTTDAGAVTTQATATKAAFASLRTDDTAFRNTLSHDIKVLDTKLTKGANNKLISTLLHDTAINYSRIAAAENSLLTTARADANAGATDGKHLLLHPTKTAYQKKVTKDIALLDAISVKLSKLETADLNASTVISPVYTEITTANPSVAAFVQTTLATNGDLNTVFSNAAVQVETDINQLAIDLTFPIAPTVTLTGATLFRGDSTGTNQDSSGGIIDHGGWTTGLDVQNVPGNYAAELFISTVANPTPSQFLTPGTLAASLTTGVNIFYFFADGDDMLGGSATFGLNLFLNGAGDTSPTLSGYTVPGTGQTLNADSSSVTAGSTFVVTPGAGTLTIPNGSSSTVTLSSFVVEGVSGQGSTVDLVNSTNTSPFTPPAHPDGIPDTYGTFTITVT